MANICELMMNESKLNLFFQFSVFEVCCVLSGKKNKKNKKNKNKTTVSILPPSVNHHSSALTLSNVSEQRAGHGLLLAFTTDIRNIHKHMRFFLKMCGQLLRSICRQEEGLFLIDADSLIQFHTVLRKYAHVHTELAVQAKAGCILSVPHFV